jgi:hypothetical protein
MTELRWLWAAGSFRREPRSSGFGAQLQPGERCVAQAASRSYPCAAQETSSNPTVLWAPLSHRSCVNARFSGASAA